MPRGLSAKDNNAALSKSDTVFLSPDQGIDLKHSLQRYLGIPYRKGGSTLKGFDCSGFVRFIYKTIFDFDLPHGSASQYRSSQLVKVPSDKLQPGDIIFFAATPSKKRINHVGIYFDDNLFIHSESKRGITLSRVDDSHWRSRMVAVKRPLFYDNEQEDETTPYNEASMSIPSVTRSASSIASLTGLCSQRDLSPLSLFILSYTRPLFLNSLTLSLNHFYIHTTPSYIDAHSASSFYFGLPSHGESVHGYNIAANFTLLSNLRISPFVTSYNRHYDGGGYHMPPQESAGINLCLIPTGSPTWSLAASFRNTTMNRRDRTQHDEHARVSDWSFTYLHRLSPTLLLSLTGEQTYDPSRQTSSDTISLDQRFFFKLHLFY
ncbi:MAG: C40 family peptidase [Desulfobacterota bacterium]|nr:C40 family peptidase [Thermodesulfobacteriota bacterium]